MTEGSAQKGGHNNKRTETINVLFIYRIGTTGEVHCRLNAILFIYKLFTALSSRNVRYKIKRI